MAAKSDFLEYRLNNLRRFSSALFITSIIFILAALKEDQSSNYITAQKEIESLKDFNLNQYSGYIWENLQDKIPRLSNSIPFILLKSPSIHGSVQDYLNFLEDDSLNIKVPLLEPLLQDVYQIFLADSSVSGDITQYEILVDKGKKEILHGVNLYLTDDLSLNDVDVMVTFMDSDSVDSYKIYHNIPTRWNYLGQNRAEKVELGPLEYLESKGNLDQLYDSVSGTWLPFLAKSSIDVDDKSLSAANAEIYGQIEKSKKSISVVGISVNIQYMPYAAPIIISILVFLLYVNLSDIKEFEPHEMKDLDWMPRYTELPKIIMSLTVYLIVPLGAIVGSFIWQSSINGILVVLDLFCLTIVVIFYIYLVRFLNPTLNVFAGKNLESSRLQQSKSNKKSL